MQVLLRGCLHDSVISLAAVDGRRQALRLYALLEGGPARMEAKEQDSLIQARPASHIALGIQRRFWCQ